MTSHLLRLFFLCLTALVAAVPTEAAADTLRNERYELEVDASGTVSVRVPGMPVRVMRPEFTVLFTETDPGMARVAVHPNYLTAPRIALRWKNSSESIEAINAWLASSALKAAIGQTGVVKPNGQGREWEFRDAHGRVTMRITGPHALETSRPFSVGSPDLIRPVATTVTGNVVSWSYAVQPGFSFVATLVLPSGQGDPIVRYTLTPHRDGYYSVAFTGVAPTALAQTLPIPQECDARGHKLFDFVLSEPDLHLPRVQVATREGNVALAPDPAECRFRLPSAADSRFGVMLENTDENLRPVLFAPLLGGAGSRMRAETPWSFTFRYVQRSGDWKETFAYIAQEIHGFRDERDNTGAGSLDDTLGRVADFLVDRDGHNYALWDEQQKYYDYFSDKTGIFKPFSPLYGLSLAIVTDDEDLFRRRALPALEFALSRRRSVFAPYDNSDNKQANSAVRTVGAPYLGYAQLLSAYELLQRRAPALLTLAQKQGPEKNNLADALATWRLTGEPQDLARARSEASRLGHRQEEELFDLVDLAEATKAPADLAAAVDAAYSNAALRLNFYPAPPDTTVTVDRGGVAPIHPHSFPRHSNVWGYPAPVPVKVPEQTVPAWRIARLGLPSPAYPIEYWMNTHGVTLRVAGLAHDRLLRDLAHWGVVGRFGNYPGDNRSIDSLVPEAPDAVVAPPWQWNFATVNPGHAWDFAAAMLDFLVSDAFERSQGRIDFPALPAAGSAFRVRLYGGGPGEFYGDTGVYLWVPRGLISTENRQIDWLAGYGNGELYVALWNQSSAPQTVTARIAPALAECEDGREARVWQNNTSAAPIRVTGNRITLSLSAKGITALAIPARTKPRLQARLYDHSVPPLPAPDLLAVDTSFGPVHALLLRSERTTAFVYTEALPEKVIAARLRWRQGAGAWQESVDTIYPYEFSPVLNDTAGDFFCVLEIEDAQQRIVSSPVIALPLGSKPSELPPPPPAKPFPSLASPAQVAASISTPPLSDEFVGYLKQAANRDNYGLRQGRYYPYSTPQGRRIGWRQPIWSDELFAKGCSPAEAETQLRAELAQVQAKLVHELGTRQPAVDFAMLDQRQRETLLDLAFTEGALSPALIEVVLARDWGRMEREHLYVRYAGHAPDHVRNKAFATRWQIK